MKKYSKDSSLSWIISYGCSAIIYTILIKVLLVVCILYILRKSMILFRKCGHFYKFVYLHARNLIFLFLRMWLYHRGCSPHNLFYMNASHYFWFQDWVKKRESFLLKAVVNTCHICLRYLQNCLCRGCFVIYGLGYMNLVPLQKKKAWSYFKVLRAFKAKIQTSWNSNSRLF